MIDRRRFERFNCSLDTVVIDKHGNECDAIIRNVSLHGIGVEIYANLEYNIGDIMQIYIVDNIFVNMKIIRKNDTESRNWYYGLEGDDMNQQNMDRILLLAN